VVIYGSRNQRTRIRVDAGREVTLLLVVDLAGHLTGPHPGGTTTTTTDAVESRVIETCVIGAQGGGGDEVRHDW
jgi:hypothetical protein